jgi:hypothetical protein
VHKDAHHTIDHELDERICAYEQCILTNCAACSLARKRCIAEREEVHCASDEALSACIQVLEVLRHQARFALHATDERAALPHAKVMRIQVGGLRGIQAALAPDEPVPGRIADIRRTVRAALAQFGDLSRLPFHDIVKEIAAYQSRRRLRRRE